MAKNPLLSELRFDESLIIPNAMRTSQALQLDQFSEAVKAISKGFDSNNGKLDSGFGSLNNKLDSGFGSLNNKLWMDCLKKLLPSFQINLMNCLKGLLKL